MLYVGLRKKGTGKEGDVCSPVSFMEDVEKYIFLKKKGRTEGEYATCVVDEEKLNLLGLSEKEAWNIALNNTEQETIISPFFSIFGMYIISNKELFKGAGGILSPNILKKLKEITAEKITIIPSSIHELLILPTNDVLNEDELNSLILEANNTCLSEGQVLSNRLYKIDLNNIL